MFMLYGVITRFLAKKPALNGACHDHARMLMVRVSQVRAPSLRAHSGPKAAA
jgi:hypothetical protein